MDSGAKIFWAFVGGAVVGAAGLAYLNHNKMDFSYMKPCATRWMSKGLNMKDNVVKRMSAMKEDFEDMAAEARDQVDAERQEKAETAAKKA